MHDTSLTRRNFLRGSVAAILGGAALPDALQRRYWQHGAVEDHSGRGCDLSQRH